jgi:hypothetical protein
MMTTTRWTKTAVSIFALVCVGCGESGPNPPVEELVPVNGTVRLSGTPAAGIRVSFVPAGSTSGNGAFAVTDESGAYELLHNVTQEPGTLAGNYTVQFSRFMMPDGAPVPENQSPFAVNAQESIPLAWSSPAHAGPHNAVTVPAGGTTLNFEIPRQ